MMSLADVLVQSVCCTCAPVTFFVSRRIGTSQVPKYIHPYLYTADVLTPKADVKVEMESRGRGVVLIDKPRGADRLNLEAISRHFLLRRDRTYIQLYLYAAPSFILLQIEPSSGL